MKTSLPLSLPWPAWHLDDSDAALRLLWKASDRALVKMLAEQARFKSAHNWRLWKWGELVPNRWELSNAERTLEETVTYRIRSEIVSRFVKREETRQMKIEVRKELRAKHPRIFAKAA